ncbi:hypothetical protein F383_24444 [Gossypium arboreum]|uniref:Uncharacterized protein n=1 Tax=Gossypium arboreum TaxID=29729 RepID=A0A0B0NYZ1_GOSAR|nr:hypothetical protein F383_24444 [Gossypium arboreum]
MYQEQPWLGFGQASKLNNQVNRDLSLNRENTRLWTRMVNCHFWI